jgi:hypothetical protein
METADSRAVVRFYNKRGTAGAVDQGRQASGEDDAAELPSVPVQRCAVAERDRLQSGEPVAAAGAAKENRQLVADEFAAAAGENETGGRLVKHARYYWLLLAESHLTRRLLGSMVERIEALPVPTG